MAGNVGTTGDLPVPETDGTEAGPGGRRSGKAGQQDGKPTGKAPKAGGKARKTGGRAAKSRAGGRSDLAGGPAGKDDAPDLRGLVMGALSATNSLPPLDLTAGRRPRSAYSAAVLLRPDDGRPGPAIPARPQPAEPRAGDAGTARAGPQARPADVTATAGPADVTPTEVTPTDVTPTDVTATGEPTEVAPAAVPADPLPADPVPAGDATAVRPAGDATAVRPAGGPAESGPADAAPTAGPVDPPAAAPSDTTPGPAEPSDTTPEPAGAGPAPQRAGAVSPPSGSVRANLDPGPGLAAGTRPQEHRTGRAGTARVPDQAARPADPDERRRPARLTGAGPARDPRALEPAPSGPPSPRGRPRPGGPRRAATNQMPALIADELAAELGFTPERFDQHVAAGIEEITAGILPNDPLFGPLAGPDGGGVRPALAEPTLYLPTVGGSLAATGSPPAGDQGS